MSARKFAAAAAISFVIIYLLLAGGSAKTRRPWCDEGWFANPAYNLLAHGTMGTTVLEPAGHYRHPWGIREHTYWITPLHIVAQAGWYRVVGFGLGPLRALSIVWGLIGLAAWYQIVRLLTGSRGAALAAAGLLCCDFTYVSTASTGRMDMMSAALGWAALAAYLTFRERRFHLAIGTSHGFAAASGLTHPVGGVLALAALVFVTVRMDRKRLELRHAGLAALPYLAGAAGWGVYIAQSPGDFVQQFGANASGRFSQIFSPLRAVRAEVVRRYLHSFGFADFDSGASRAKVLMPAILFAGFAVAWWTRRMRSGGTGTLLGVAAICAGALAIFDSTRQSYYLVHSMTALAVVLAVLARTWWIRGGARRIAAAGVVCLLAAVNVGSLGYRILRLDTMRSGYLPAAQFLKKPAAAGKLIFASGEFGFALGFDSNLTDDPTLGYYTRRSPDFIVVDPLSYREAFDALRRNSPEVHEHVTRLLEKSYEKVYDRGAYQIYARRSRRDAAVLR